MRPTGEVILSAALENVGNRAGTETVQLYIRALAASLTRPVRELKGFQRVMLQPGEKRQVEFVITADLLGGYNREMNFVVEPGEYRLMIGSNSEAVTEKSFQVVER